MTGWAGIDRLATPHDVAELLGVSTATVARLRRSGHLPGVLIGNRYRYEPRDIAEYIERNKRTTPNGNQ